jgi:hypothetical protein
MIPAGLLLALLSVSHARAVVLEASDEGFSIEVPGDWKRVASAEPTVALELSKPGSRLTFSKLPDLPTDKKLWRLAQDAASGSPEERDYGNYGHLATNEYNQNFEHVQVAYLRLKKHAYRIEAHGILRPEYNELLDSVAPPLTPPGKGERVRTPDNGLEFELPDGFWSYPKGQSLVIAPRESAAGWSIEVERMDDLPMSRNTRSDDLTYRFSHSQSQNCDPWRSQPKMRLANGWHVIPTWVRCGTRLEQAYSFFRVETLGRRYVVKGYEAGLETIMPLLEAGRSDPSWQVQAYRKPLLTAQQKEDLPLWIEIVGTIVQVGILAYVTYLLRRRSSS